MVLSKTKLFQNPMLNPIGVFFVGAKPWSDTKRGPETVGRLVDQGMPHGVPGDMILDTQKKQVSIG